jgi:P27 family predicted phage terminase small subunit
MVNAKGQGRKKTPSALLKGIDGGMLRPNEPKPPEGAVRMPSGLSSRAQSQWRKLAPDLIKMGTLTPVDAPAFAIYCEQWNVYDRAQAAVNEFGPTVKGRNGEPIRNPSYSIMRDSVMLIDKLGQQFGLTPGARAGITVPSSYRDDAPLGRHLNGGKIYAAGDLSEFTD